MTEAMNTSDQQTFTIVVTDAAARRVSEIGDELGFNPAETGLRAGVTEGGCSGLNYDVQVVQGPRPEDTIYEFNGTRVFVNDFSVPHVHGMRVDWKSTFQEQRFVFENPNATGGCGCGMSFTTS